LTLDEDQDDQKIAKWVTVHPPISGQFSPVADKGHTGCREVHDGRCGAVSVAGVAVLRCCTADLVLGRQCPLLVL
ncbi:hypothetical protein ABT124_48695, partial [Streptomyces sp. NPDC001982]|uniref:hypothetical protein n=1 Tax=Streptomyces sp. NPDC001982 TaxID=3154405 RepID=UPI00332F9DA9